VKPCSTSSASLINSSTQSIAAPEVLADQFSVSAYPNPSLSQFTLKISSNNTREAISVRVINQMGQVVEVRNNLVAGQTIQFGNTYRSGAYFVEVIQGKERRQLKLIKN
jgi:hypothetical protein